MLEHRRRCCQLTLLVLCRRSSGPVPGMHTEQVQAQQEVPPVVTYWWSRALGAKCHDRTEVVYGTGEGRGYDVVFPLSRHVWLVSVFFIQRILP